MTESMKRAGMRRWLGACAVAGMGLGLAPLANADTVLLETTSYITGTQSAAYEMTVNGPGTLNIKLQNLAWPERLQSLTFALTTSGTVLERLSAEGTLSYRVDGPGSYFAVVAGQAQGMWDAGMYSLRIGFDQVAAVPLPAGVWLLLSGIAGLYSVRRRGGGKETVTNAG